MPRHSSDILLVEMLVFAKHMLAKLGIASNDELDLFASEMADYCKFGDPEDKQAGELFGKLASRYKE
jgi:hypothetical protein